VEVHKASLTMVINAMGSDPGHFVRQNELNGIDRPSGEKISGLDGLRKLRAATNLL
jgi:hypothetical protein